MGDYQYQVEDKSLMQDFLIKYVWNPMLRLIPKSIKPNNITWLGFLFVCASAFFIWFALQGRDWGFISAAFCILFYMACDNIDGIYARKTGQTSRLGEFLDHWLDSMAFVILHSGMALALGLPNWLLMTYIITMTMASFASLWEHHYTGVFRCGRISSNEALSIYALVYIFQYFFNGASWFAYNPDNLFTVANFITLIAVMGGTTTTVLCIVRVKRHLHECLLWCGGMMSIAICNYFGYIGDFTSLALILGCNTVFCGKLVIKHLVKQNSPFRHPLTLLFSATGIVFCIVHVPSQYFIYLSYSALLFSVIGILFDGFRGQKALQTQ